MPNRVRNSNRPSSYAAGQVISGKYELDSLLGEGGMGAVWRAHNRVLDTQVAIKLLRGQQNREVLGTRLLQEARAAARLGHPAIVRVFDVGETEKGDPFIEMELLHGESLASLIRTHGRLGATRAVQTLLPIADALAAAHGKKIIHRDIKPDNIFIANVEGQVQPKLVDFGVAKLEKREPGSFVTQAGVIVGSPEYMSPEQAIGSEDIDHRSDVWSFCVVLYEALSGALPFAASNYNALLYAIVHTAPPTIHAVLGNNAELSIIIERGISKDPARRWGSMVELGRALAQWLHGQGINQDICGMSLDAKWLRRSADEDSGVSGRASVLDGDVAPQSGVRTVDLPSLLSTTPRPTGRRSSGRWFIAALLGVGVVLGSATFLRSRRIHARHDTASVATPSVQLVVNEQPPAAPGVSPSPTVLSMSPDQGAPTPTAAPPAASSSAKGSRISAPRTPTAPAQRKRRTTRSGGSDLISPY
jgi:serine/threonine-protein kinase